MERIDVTKSFLPPVEEYEEYIQKIWKSGQLTNQGPILREFEARASNYLNVRNFHFVSNGTMALQVSLKALGITEGEIITTPFSYVATTSSILWERCRPVFVDIESDTLCIDPNKIEAAITPDTKAIMGVHVFGNPCDVMAIEKIARKHSLKVIYDAAHAFAVEYDGKSLLDYGDISTCSFHATKLFHTIEGGAVIVQDVEVNEKLGLIKKFGHFGDEHHMLGTNAKASEFQAAMGLCNLNYIDEIIGKRKKLTNHYDNLLDGTLRRPKMREKTKYNYAYYPVIFENEEHLLLVMKHLNEENIFPRRYFYPSLNELPYVGDLQECPVSEDIAKRILCLPLYADLEETVISRVCEIIKR